MEVRSIPRRGRGAGSCAGLGQKRATGRSDATPAVGRAARRRGQPSGCLRGATVAADAALREGSALMDRFDLLGPLPPDRSTTVLEASAGTGKTFALAGLVTRYVAEGEATLDQMLLITFGRAASQELRDRVRRQITHAAAAFDDPSLVGDNRLVEYLVTGTDVQRAARRQRLRDAL